MTARQILLPGPPVRIQRRRAMGWRMPDNTIYVGRPTKWGNLWDVGLVSCGCRSAGECDHNQFRCETAAEAVEQFQNMWGLRLNSGKSPFFRRQLEELRGRNLACWCPLDQPCHADVLLAIANGKVG
jgi:hypothetical protein